MKLRPATVSAMLRGLQRYDVARLALDEGKEGGGPETQRQPSLVLIEFALRFGPSSEAACPTPKKKFAALAAVDTFKDLPGKIAQGHDVFAAVLRSISREPNLTLGGIDLGICKVCYLRTALQSEDE